MHVWAYTFELDLDTYRQRGDLPSDSSNPYFHMFLLDNHNAGKRFVKRHRGTHPMDEHYPHGFVVRSTPTEHRRWSMTQDAVLTALRKIAADTVRAIRNGAGARALRECHTQMVAVAAEHQPVWLEVNARINESIERDYPQFPAEAQFPSHTPSEAQRARENHERNTRYGGGYSSG